MKKKKPPIWQLRGEKRQTLVQRICRLYGVSRPGNPWQEKVTIPELLMISEEVNRALNECQSADD